jgi:hypothetical protein
MEGIAGQADLAGVVLHGKASFDQAAGFFPLRVENEADTPGVHHCDSAGQLEHFGLAGSPGCRQERSTSPYGNSPHIRCQGLIFSMRKWVWLFFA